MTKNLTFVLGDLHGHLDRLEALLLQEGLIDRCLACDGSGDFENDFCPKCHGDGWTRLREDVEVVLLGDVAHNGADASPTGDMLTWQYADRWADYILWGNHDRAVVDKAHAFSGYLPPQAATCDIMNKVYNEGRLLLAYEAHGYLLTHAGLHVNWRNQDVSIDKSDPAVVAQWINQGNNLNHVDDVVDTQVIGVRDAVAYTRGGQADAGGILWRDIGEKLYGGFPQVFGHSADFHQRQVRYCNQDSYSRDSTAIKYQSLCIDIGGKNDACLAGVWLPSQRVVRVDL